MGSVQQFAGRTLSKLVNTGTVTKVVSVGLPTMVAVAQVTGVASNIKTLFDYKWDNLTVLKIHSRN